MTTVKYRVRSKRVSWTKTFKTLAEAQIHARRAWAYQNDPTVFIEKISVDIIAV